MRLAPYLEPERRGFSLYGAFWGGDVYLVIEFFTQMHGRVTEV